MSAQPLPSSSADSRDLLSENARLREQNTLLEAVIEHFPGGIILTDKDLEVLICNRQQRALLQYPDFLFSRGNPSLYQLFRFNALRGEYGPGDVDRIVGEKMELARKGEAHIFERKRPNGQVIEVRGIPLPEGGFVTSYTDVTDNRVKQAGIAELALKDALTGLANRSLFNDRLNQALAAAGRGDGFALHYIDLDDFKPINDQHGHDAGDCVLREIAQRLREVSRATDTVARLGGDEFVVIQAKSPRQYAAELLAQRFLLSISKPINFNGVDLVAGASIGIALSSISRDAVEIVKLADQAAYESKRRGKNTVTVSNSQLSQDVHSSRQASSPRGA